MKMWLDWLLWLQLWLPLVLWPLLEMARQLAAWRALRAMPSPPVNDDDVRFTGVDVLQPIRSGDPTLAEALGASLRALGARGAMLHWLIDSDDLAAARITRSVVDAQPTLRAQVAISAHPQCPPESIRNSSNSIARLRIAWATPCWCSTTMRGCRQRRWMPCSQR